MIEIDKFKPAIFKIWLKVALDESWKGKGFTIIVVAELFTEMMFLALTLENRIICFEHFVVSDKLLVLETPALYTTYNTKIIKLQLWVV